MDRSGDSAGGCAYEVTIDDDHQLPFDQHHVTEDDTWQCPHDTYNDRKTCVFHASKTEENSPPEEMVTDAFVRVIHNDGPSEFVGAEFNRLSLNGAHVDMNNTDILDLREATFHGSFNFIHSVLEQPIIASGAKFQSSVSLKRSVFKARLDLADCEVSGDLDLTESTVEGQLNADDTTVDGALVLESTTVSSTASFRDVTVYGETEASFSTFETYPEFVGTTFVGEAMFGGSDFNRGAVYNEATFESDADFGNTDFGEVGRFINVTFAGDTAEFNSAYFRDDVRIENVTASATMVFSRAQIGTDIHLSASQFEAPVRFQDTVVGGAVLLGSSPNTSKTHEVDGTTKVSGPLLFNGAQIGGEAVFSGVTVHEKATFESTRFGGTVWFDDVQFDRATQFNGTQFDGPTSFESADFRESAEFKRTKFDGSTTFKNVAIAGDARFDDARFVRKTSFVAATIEAKASFESANFEDIVAFTDATVGNGNFYLADFNSITVFDNAIFETAVTFEKAHFGQRGKFDATEFRGPAEFGDAQFDDDCMLTSVLCTETLSLIECRIEGNLVCTDGTFNDIDAEKSLIAGDIRFDGDTEVDGNVSFDRARLNGECDFSDLTVVGHASFNQTDFLAETHFRSTVFERGARFDSTRFRRNVDFRSVETDTGQFSFQYVTIQQDSDFTDAEFRSGAEFEGVTFSRRVEFRDATFSAGADFSGAVFHSGAIFERAEFDGTTVFDRAKFRGSTTFDEVTAAGLEFKESEHRTTTFAGVAPGERMGLCDADIDSVELSVDAGQNEGDVFVDLAGATVRDGHVALGDSAVVFVDMTEAEIGTVEFTPKTRAVVEQVRWLRTRFNGFNFSDYRQALADDWKIHTATDGDQGPNVDVDAIIDTYMYAKQGATAVTDENVASEFYLQEMRYRRKAHARRARNSNLRTIKRLNAGRRYVSSHLLDFTCGYGERVFRPVRFSLLTIGLFAVVYALLGIDTLEIGSETVPVGLFGYVSMSFQSFLAVLLGVPEGATLALTAIIAFEAFIGAFSIALFVFTFTRSLKR